MKRTFFALLLITGLVGTSFAQVGDTFPALTGETLTDQEVTLPDDASGKYTLIGMAYSKKAEDDLQSWFQPVYRKFVQDREDAGLFAGFTYDINVYFIPMFSGAKRVATKRSRESAKKRLDVRLHKLVLFYVGGLDEYAEALEFDGKNKPYVFLIDEEGKIVYATSGRCTPEKLDAIESEIDDL